MSCIYEQNKVAKIDSGAHQTFSWLWCWSKWLPYDVTMFPSQWISFPRKQISSCRQCWLLTQFFKQKILNAVNSFCWFDRDYSGLIPESQNVFLSYPGFVIRVAGHVIWIIPSRLSIVSDTKLHVWAKFGWSSGRLKHPTGDRARVHLHPAKSMTPSLIQGLCHSLLAFYVLHFCSRQNILS